MIAALIVVLVVAIVAIAALTYALRYTLEEAKLARIAAANERGHLYARIDAGKMVTADGFEPGQAPADAWTPPGRRKLHRTEADEIDAQLQRQRAARESTLAEIARLAAEEGVAV